MVPERRRMWETAEAIGLRIRPGMVCPDTAACPWNGEALYDRVRFPAGAEAQGSDHWHEIGHALVAPMEGWKHAGWGQGTIYDGTPGGPYLRDDPATEVHASAVGIWVQHALGLTPDGAAQHARYHSWSGVTAVWRYLHESRGRRASQGLPRSTFPKSFAGAMVPRTRLPRVVMQRVVERLSAAGLRHPWDGLARV